MYNRTIDSVQSNKSTLSLIPRAYYITRDIESDSLTKDPASGERIKERISLFDHRCYKLECADIVLPLYFLRGKKILRYV